MNIDHFLPKYYRISEEIKSLIKKGTLAPDMKVPSENEIIATYGVSNTTARKALLELEHEGYVSRVRGKGTFVNNRIIHRSVTRILGFTKNMIESGHIPSAKHLDTGILKSGYGDCINHQQYDIKDKVCRIKRLRFADNIPMMIEERFISLKECPNINELNLESSLYDIYEKEYNHRLVEIRQMIRASIICKEMKNYFEVEDDISVFVVTGVTYCEDGKILEMEKSTYRGDRYNFSVIAK